MGVPESFSTLLLGCPTIMDLDSLGRTSCRPLGSAFDAIPSESLGNPILLSSASVSSLLVFVSSSDLGFDGFLRARSTVPDVVVKVAAAVAAVVDDEAAAAAAVVVAAVSAGGDVAAAVVEDARVEMTTGGSVRSSRGFLCRI